MNNPARSFTCRFCLRQYDTGVIEKGSTRRCQFDPASAARQELGAHLILKIPNLPTQRWLRRVQHSLGRHRQVSRFRNRDEVAKMS
jgi:hypothetical protein